MLHFINSIFDVLLFLIVLHFIQQLLESKRRLSRANAHSRNSLSNNFARLNNPLIAQQSSSLGNMGRNVRYFHRKFMADKASCIQNVFLSNRKIRNVLGSWLIKRHFVQILQKLFSLFTNCKTLRRFP
jgi:hypothetical protein